MPELRIILLIIGVLFVAGIAGFEWWRSRAQRLMAGFASRRGATLDVREAAEPEAREPPRVGERGDRSELKPLPEINVVREPRVAVQESLPVIELTSTSESGMRRALGITISDEVAVDVSHDGSAAAQAPALPPAPAAVGRAEPHFGPDGVSAARVVPDNVPTLETPKLTLSWPSEGERRIVTLRVIPKAEPRFAGRALRQAFSGCGFWHGPMDIYHLPDEQGRVMLSAAALAQPGTFDPSIMDSQRFSGLNLFAVLPGPVPEREVFEELVHSARQLAERLDGQIIDQHGEELTAERIARLRQSLETPDGRAGQA
ncbi:MAG TPA: cell division protein ZipA C-terminal FtsZ-binding domain-containing protein [Steroidobacteraceae bacterium]|nr:cell division protein ZipA C-terminal FtsZ-binding domain-containing protein [Steroidobacteraceae bacterium]